MVPNYIAVRHYISAGQGSDLTAAVAAACVCVLVQCVVL
jgi:hypothetical protein